MNNLITQQIEIKPTKDNSINVVARIYTGSRPDDGRFSCFIPGFNIYYTVNTAEEISNKSRVLIKFFLDDFFIHNKENGPALFHEELTKRGFKTNSYMHNAEKKFARNKVVKATFLNQSEVPEEFEQVNRQEFAMTA